MTVPFHLRCRIVWPALASLALGWGCAPNAGGVRPTFPWNRPVPPGATATGANAIPTSPLASTAALPESPWIRPDTDTAQLPAYANDSRRWSFLSELRRRADQQETLAELQRRRLDELRLLQRSQEERERLAAKQNRDRELGQLSKKHTAEQQRLKGQLGHLRERASELDDNNRDLHAQVARANQRSDALQDQIDNLQRQLQETTQQLASARQIGEEADSRLRAIQASTRRKTGASITANSSIRHGITAVLVPGMDIRQDGDLVRISLPADRLFMAGTATLHQGARPYLDQVADVVLRHYPRQFVGIEAHTDHDTSLHATQWRNQHQLSAAQSMAIFEQMSGRNISPHQLFVIGHGGNHPLASGATFEGQSLNNRVEVVIYPETFPQR